MPITCEFTITPMNREAFGNLTYSVFADVLSIREELGRFFDERVYKLALAQRRSDIVLEVPVWVSHGGFRKPYYLDGLLGGGGILEFKATEEIIDRHITQLLHYLMLTELPHGMIINVRPQFVSKQFVNNALTHSDRRRFSVRRIDWDAGVPGTGKFESVFVSLLSDWGTSLELSLYQDAMTFLLGGISSVIRRKTVMLDSYELGTQPFRFVEPGIAFILTAFEQGDLMEHFPIHARKLLAHTQVEALLWANIARHEVTFRCLKNQFGRKK